MREPEKNLSNPERIGFHSVATAQFSFQWLFWLLRKRGFKQKAVTIWNKSGFVIDDKLAYQIALFSLAIDLTINNNNNSNNLYFLRLAYLKDSNAAAHSVDSDIFPSSDSSICALQDLTLTFIS